MSADEVPRRLDALTRQLASVMDEVERLRREVHSLRAGAEMQASSSAVAPEPVLPPLPATLVGASGTELIAKSPIAEPPIAEAPLPAESPAEESPAEEPAAEELAADEAVLELPDVELPDVESPDVESPDVESPDVESPDVELVPGVEELAMPVSPVAPPPEQRERQQAELEAKIGGKWLQLAGSFVLIIGLGLFAREAVTDMAPWQRLAGLYLAAAVAFVAGFLADRRFRDRPDVAPLAARLREFARPTMGSGLAFAFFASYAGHFVAPTRCLPVLVSAVLMLAFVGALLWCAERWRSELVAGLAILLGHVAAFVAASASETYAMTAVVFLSLAAVLLQLRHSWLQLTLIALVTAFTSHALWAVRDLDASMSDRFAVQVAFLSLYYLIFVAADVIQGWRLTQLGRDAFTQRQRTCGRALGPTAIALYGPLTSAVFYFTEAYWPRIEIFFFVLAAVQVLLLIVHRRLRTGEAPLYGSTATVFVLLGLFGSLGGMALNLALAAQAMLLLVMGRLLFWYLRPLAQGVLAINFLHFWFSDARNLDTWPLFLGALVMAAMYYVKAYLGETWEPIPLDQRFSPKRGWFNRHWVRLYQRATVPIAHLQALAGGVLFTYQCDQFLPAPWDGLLMLGLALTVTIVGLWLHSASLLHGALWLQAGCLIFLWYTGGYVGNVTLAGSSQQVWLAAQLTVFVLAASAAVAVQVAARRRRRTYGRFASVALALSAVAGFGAAGAGTPVPWLFWLVLLGPIAIWTAIETWPGPNIHPVEAEDSERPWHEWTLRFYHGGERMRVLFSVVAALLTGWAVDQALPSVTATLVVLSLLGLVLAVVVVVRNSPYLLVGLGVHLVFTGALARVGLDVGEAYQNLARWGTVAAATLVCLGLQLASARRQRCSFGVGGGLAGVLAGVQLGLLCLEPAQGFDPLALWLLPMVGLWGGIELFRGNPGRCAGTQSHWTDRWGSQLFLERSQGLAATASVLLAVLTGTLLGRHFEPDARALLWALIVAAGALLAAALWRDSPYLLSGLITLLGLLTAQRLLHAASLSSSSSQGWTLQDAALLEWACATTLVVVGVILLLRAPRCRRTSFAWGGLMALSLFVFASAELWLVRRPEPLGIVPWLVAFAMALAGLELLQRGFHRRCGDDEESKWVDAFGLRQLCTRSQAYAIAGALMVALLLIAYSSRQFDAAVVLLAAIMGYCLALVGAAVLLKSQPLVAAFAVCLTALHPLFYFRLGPERAAAEAPVLSLAILLLTLLAGVAVEHSFRHPAVAAAQNAAADGKSRRQPAWWGAWYPYILSFFMAGLFLHPYGQHLVGLRAFGAPAQLVFGVLACALAAALRLRWLTRAAMTYGFAVAALLVLQVLAVTDYRQRLIVAAVLCAVQLLAMERIVDRQALTALSAGGHWRVKWIKRQLLVVVAAVLLLAALYFDQALRGSWTTAAWSVAAVAFLVLGFLWRSGTYRRVGLGIFGVTIVRVFAVDARGLEAPYQTLAFICLGVSMVVVSYLYQRYRQRIDRWLAAEEAREESAVESEPEPRD